MNGITASVIILAAGLTAVVTAGLLLWIISIIIANKLGRLETDIAHTQIHLAQMSRDIQELKNRHLHPYPTREGLEDALAIADDVIREYQASQKYSEGRVRQLVHILKVVRADPHGYREAENRKVNYEKRGGQ